MRKYLQLMLLGAVVLGLAGSAGAEYYNEGHSGTAADPYVIDTNADLVMLRDRVNAGTESADKYYRLTQNLDISQYTDWESIGSFKDINSVFRGHFDGNNHTISVNINRADDTTSSLFGTIWYNCSVTNLNVTGDIQGKEYTGGIASQLYGFIEGCTFTGTLLGISSTSPTTAGGIVSMNAGTIKNCTVNAQIKAVIDGENRRAFNSYAGGIACTMLTGEIENCTVIASSDGIYAYSHYEKDNPRVTYAGGILACGDGSIKDCTFSGMVSSVYYAGGIVGAMLDTGNGNISNNHVISYTNNPTIITAPYASGGIAGASGRDVIIESCDVSGDVTISLNTGQLFQNLTVDNPASERKIITCAESIGGIVGILEVSEVSNFDSLPIVKDNQSYASINSNTVKQGGIIGKIYGTNTDYTISNNRYSSAEHGIGNNAQGIPSEEGCIKVGASISITTASPLTQAVKDSAYSVTLASDSSSPVVWSLTNSTTLPAGLTLDRTTGTISGTPTKTGTYTFTVKASPASGAPATKEFTLTVSDTAPAPAPTTPTPTTSITITTTSLPSGTVGSSYTASLAANISGAVWSVSSGSLPAGLTLNSSTGNISGTPTASGTSTFTVRAVSGSANAEKTLSITINQSSTQTPATSITITTTSLPSGTAGQSYSASLASNPSGATWAVSAGSLPPGLSLSSSGSISGTPTTAGTAVFTVRASYGSATATQNLTITINAPSLSITTSSLPSGRVGTSYNETVKASASGVTWSVYAGSLPNGLTLSESQGVISGTPTSSGTFSFTLQARNNYASTTKSFSITIYSSSNDGTSENSSGGGGCNSSFGLLELAALLILRRKH